MVAGKVRLRRTGETRGEHDAARRGPRRGPKLSETENDSAQGQGDRTRVECSTPNRRPEQRKRMTDVVNARETRSDQRSRFHKRTGKTGVRCAMQPGHLTTGHGIGQFQVGALHKLKKDHTITSHSSTSASRLIVPRSKSKTRSLTPHVTSSRQ